MLTTRSFRALAAAAALALLAPVAQASTCTTAGLTTSTACVGQIAGNDQDKDVGGSNVNVNTHLGGLFGITTWTQTNKVDEPATSDGILSVTYDSGKKTGTWSVTSWAGFADVMLVVKGGNGFIAYLIDTLAGTSGTWSTAGLTNNGGQQPEISHLSLYTTRGDTPPPPPVPLPAAGWLMLAGLGGLAALRRRRKAA